MVFLAHFCGSGGSAYRVLRIIWFQVTSGINRGSNYGHHMLYSGVVAEDREALISGVPSLSSLNWRKDESQENDFKDAVAVCLPLINAAIRDIEKGEFPKSCFLNIEIPSSPLSNKAMAPRSNNTAKAKAIALRMKALQMKRDKKTVSKPAVEETNAPPKSAFTKHDQ